MLVHETIETIKNAFLAEPFCKTATDGDIFDVDLNKSTIYPLTHVMMMGFTDNGSTVTFDVSVICADIIDETKTEQSNKNSIWNVQSAMILRVLSSIRRGYLSELNWELTSVNRAEFFTDKYDHALAGVEQSFTVTVPNTMSIC